MTDSLDPLAVSTNIEAAYKRYITTCLRPGEVLLHVVPSVSLDAFMAPP